MIPRRGGTLRFIQETVSTLDPKEIGDVYSGTVEMQIHRGLLAYNTSLVPVPDVARTWTISRDGKKYTFELNRGVKFHNGRELIANDFVYTVERIFRPGGNPGLAGQYLSVIEGSEAFRNGRAARIDGLSAPSRYTVEVRLSRSDAAFLWALAMNQVHIVPREVVEALGNQEFGRHPVGCGPYKLVSSTPHLIKLAAFDGYFRARAYLDSLFFVTPENHTTSLGTTILLQGGCDLAEVPGFRRGEVGQAPGIRLVSRRELVLSFIGLNSRVPPLDNPDVRRAMAMSVDRQALIKLNPAGQVLPTGILPPGISCFSPEIRILPFDLDQARALLARAGYPGGRGLPEVVFISPRGSDRARMADSVNVSNWRRVGISIKHLTTDWVHLQEKLDKKEIPVFSLSWIADIPDPDSFIGALFASDSPNNYYRYANKEVDSLLVVGRTIVDPRARQAVYGRMEKIILNDAPIIPLYTGTTAYGVRNRVHGLELTPLGISCVDLAHVWLEEDELAGKRIP